MSVSKPPDERALPVMEYPHLESFAETAQMDEVESLYRDMTESLKGLKGPAAQQAARVQQGIVATQELLRFLLETRERLLKEAGPGRR